MRISNLINFRKDLLFDGAVQLNWWEDNEERAIKAAKSYIFHGPDYHGVNQKENDYSMVKLVDTVSFTENLINRIYEGERKEPFILAVAGYGAGKSHLGITIATLLSSPSSVVAKEIIENVIKADEEIGRRIEKNLKEKDKPNLIVALNGMDNFDLNNKIIGQVTRTLRRDGHDISPIEDWRPRFKRAIRFTHENFNRNFSDFKERFGGNISKEKIVDKLENQDENTFENVNDIYQKVNGGRIRATEQESLNDFIKLVKENFCGAGKPYNSILIIFDEFGRFLEFSVQRPHVAGPGALQQLYESVQANNDKVFLVCFIQNELNAYVSRIAPELRDELKRYVTRYEVGRKIRLSTNLETLIANLLEKKDLGKIRFEMRKSNESINLIETKMRRWFPEVRNHNIWVQSEHFEKVVCEGCWPFHPISIWILFKLSSVGRSLQQRSALSFISEIFEENKDKEIEEKRVINPVELCNESMISEFLSSEEFGQRRPIANSFVSVIEKYQNELGRKEKSILKGIMLASKIGIKIENKEEYFNALSMFCGINSSDLRASIQVLEEEFSVITWDSASKSFDITSEAIPRKEFLSHLKKEVEKIDPKQKGELVRFHLGEWLDFFHYETDFGQQNNISTKDWHYNIHYSDPNSLEKQISNAFKKWEKAINVDEGKGQLIYCYVGIESDVEKIKSEAIKMIREKLSKLGNFSKYGAPIAILFLDDRDGFLGEKIAEYWVLKEVLAKGDFQREYDSYIKNQEQRTFLELKNKITELEKEQKMYFATEEKIENLRLKKRLEKLFEIVYPKRVSFPFDGFNTARGNAAKDCQLFTKELFLNRFDTHWLGTLNFKQRNRASDVIQNAWGAIDKDGTVKLFPNEETIRELFEMMEGRIKGDESSKPMNLAEILMDMCAPPYGLNIASAGLLIAMFFGKRKDSGLNLIIDGESITINDWLQKAIPQNFLDLSILEASEVVIISEEGQGEWEVLLEKWEEEKELEKSIELREKARELKKKIQLPQNLFHKYELLEEKTKHAEKKLNDFNFKFEKALSKFSKGERQNDFSLLSDALVELHYQKEIITKERDLWSKAKQKAVIENFEKMRKKVIEIFPEWLGNLEEPGFDRIKEYKEMLLGKIRKNLEILDLEKEKEQLEDNTKKVEQRVTLSNEIRKLEKDVSYLVKKNQNTEGTPVYLLEDLIDRANVHLESINSYPSLDFEMEEALKSAETKLNSFIKNCKKQIEDYKERIVQIFNIDQINNLNELTQWRNETATLIAVNKGHDKDVQDLLLVQKQFDLIEKHIRELRNENLSFEELEENYKNCINETLEYFSNDEPPLDYEAIYSSVKELIIKRRETIANKWIKDNLPVFEKIKNYEAQKAIEVKKKLNNWPKVLSNEQIEEVRKAISLCDKRIEELEVKGLIARFCELSEESKKQFLDSIKSYFE